MRSGTARMLESTKEDGSQVYYVEHLRYLRSIPAAPGWWARYGNRQDEIWYEPVACWAEINVGHSRETAAADGKRISQTVTFWHGDGFDGDEEYEVEVRGVIPSDGGLEIVGSDQFQEYVWDPNRKHEPPQ